MTNSSSAADAAIQKLVDTYKEMADEEKAMAPKREAAQQKLDQLVDDMASMGTFDETKVSDEMIAAFAMFMQSAQQRMMMGDPSAQMQMAKFNETFMNDFNAYMQTAQADQAKMQGIQMAAQGLMQDMQPPRIPSNETMFDVAMVEPEDGFGEWTMSFVAIKIDEEYNVTMADTLDFDLDVSLEVSPAKSLSDEFNVPGKRYKAGQKFEPFTITHETAEGDNVTQLEVKGHVYKDGQRLGGLQMPPRPLFKQEEMGMDMEALMKMMGGGNGPGPNGPN